MLGYPTYPDSSILQQKHCITSALQHIHHDIDIQKLLTEHACSLDPNFACSGSSSSSSSSSGSSSSDSIDRHDGDKLFSIILIGHSSGANIGALSILPDLPTEDSTSKVSTVTEDSSFLTGARTNKHTNNASSLVDLFIGLSGVYDIWKHYDFEGNYHDDDDDNGDDDDDVYDDNE